MQSPQWADKNLQRFLGNNGWLGIAGIEVNTDGHITKGYTKLNDYYFNQSYYNSELWRQSVLCQEVGHDFGLGHQDENFDLNDLDSCMDYQDPPYPSPNEHDYEQLETIYAHLDSDVPIEGEGVCNAPAGRGCNKAGNNGDIGWGMSLGRRGNAETFVRIEPDGTRHLTHVTWVKGH